MPKNWPPPALTGQAGEQPAALEGILKDLRSPNAATRANAVRMLCPCRTAWDAPIEGYVLAMGDDPSREVRRAAEHVMYAVRDNELGNDRGGRSAAREEDRTISARRHGRGRYGKGEKGNE
jgi:hypothetical protein